MTNRFFILLFTLGFYSISNASELTIIRDQDTVMISMKNVNKILVIDVNLFASALEYETNIESDGKKLLIKSKPPIYFQQNNPFVIVGDKIHQLRLPVERVNQEFYVPFDWILKQFSINSIEKMEYDSKRSILSIKPQKANWSGVTLTKKTDTQVSLELLLPRGPSVKYYSKDSTITFEIYGATTDAKNFKIKSPQGFLASNKLTVDKQPHRLLLKFQSKVLLIETTDSRNFLVTISPKQKVQNESIPTQNIGTQVFDTPKPIATPELNQKLRDEQKKRWEIDCIAIDAGHGGHDPGAIGNKLKEKDITLDIALKLKSLLEKEPNLRIVMTRETDVFIPLQTRTKIANREKAKLFVSIHINAAKNTKARGTETYFLSPAKTENALKVSEFENQVIRLEQDTSQYEKLTDENFILLSMAQSQYLRESQEFAFLTQRNVVKRLGVVDRGVDQAGFYVLIGASMPAILFEAAFISNSQDAKILKSETGRRAFAESIAKAVIEFRSRVNSQGN